MPSNTKSELKSCGFLVFRSDPHHSFLLMRHHDRWDLPKGHLDHGETETQCALRELQEETGIDLPDIEMDPQFCYRQRYPILSKSGAVREKELVLFLAKLINPVEIQITEHIGFQWHDWEPPHQIQTWTIDPLLAAVAAHWRAPGS